MVLGKINTRWLSLGGKTGTLGAPLSNEKSVSSYFYQEFNNGYIFVDTQYGVHQVIKSSTIGKAWYGGGKNSASGYGIPISDETKSAGGIYQKFSNGKWIFDTGYSLNTKSPIGTRWIQDGISLLGVPTSAETCGQLDGGCYQVFKKATIFWSSKTGAQVSAGGILARYKLNGALKSGYGYPLGSESCGLPQKGCRQNFQNGFILWTSATGAHAVRGGIGSHYVSSGTVNGVLKFPSGEETCGLKNGGCYQYYQGGIIYWTSATGSHSIQKGKLYDGASRRGWAGGVLGYPTNQQVCGQPNGGCYQEFQGGRLWSNNAHGNAYMTNAGIGSSYLAKGGPSSFLGYPISDEKCSGGQCVQTFVGGYIGWGPNAAGYYNMSECQNLNNGNSRYSAGGSKHALLTFTQSYGQSYASNVYCKNIAGIYVTEWKTDGYVGTSGFKSPGVASGPTRYLYSPTGAYTVTEAFGLGNPGTKLPYRTLNPNSRWGGNPYTSTYNKYFESTSWIGYDENMWYFATRAAHDYRQGAVINYNRPNITQDAGFAIFLHENKIPTAGCISLDDWAVVDYLQKSVSGDRIIMGVKSAIFK